MGALSVGELTLDPASSRATRAGVELKLGKIPFQILTLLVRRAPHLVSRQEVLDTVWGDEEPDSDALRSHIYALRNALDKPFPTPMLETLHGQGYRLVTS
jgi:DNA-binding response OmpR family regulator